MFPESLFNKRAVTVTPPLMIPKKATAKWIHAAVICAKVNGTNSFVISAKNIIPVE